MIAAEALRLLYGDQVHSALPCRPGPSMTLVRATLMTTMRRIHGKFVQILRNDHIVLIHHEVLTATKG
jgi:hypothetical protein